MKTCTSSRFRRVISQCVLVALVPLALDGCLSIGVDRFPSATPAAGGACSLEARLYESGGDAEKDIKSTRRVTWKLFHLDASPDLPVTEGAGAVWSATDLKPGKYRLAASWGMKPGDTSEGSGDKMFTLAAGETARADFILSKFPTWGWVAIGVGGAALVIGILAAIIASGLND